jgi:hypothetical protein
MYVSETGPAVGCVPQGKDGCMKALVYKYYAQPGTAKEHCISFRRSMNGDKEKLTNQVQT